MDILVLLLPLTAIIAGLVIFLLIGVYVYRDATARGMNGLLWAIVAMFVPSFIGIIVYLIVRENYSSLICSNCGVQVNPGYNTCPKCGSSLKGKCSNCGAFVEPEFKVCPNCAHELSHDQFGVVGTLKKKSSNGPLIALLVVFIIIPLLMVVAFILFMIPMRTGTVNFQEGRIEFNEVYSEDTRSAIFYGDDESMRHVLIIDSKKKQECPLRTCMIRNKICFSSEA